MWNKQIERKYKVDENWKHKLPLPFTHQQLEATQINPEPFLATDILKKKNKISEKITTSTLQHLGTSFGNAQKWARMFATFHHMCLSSVRDIGDFIKTHLLPATLTFE